MDGCGFTASSVLYRDLLYMYVDQTLHWIIWNKISSDEHSSLVILRESNRDRGLVYDYSVYDVDTSVGCMRKREHKRY